MAKNTSDMNRYIQSAKLDGKAIKQTMVLSFRSGGWWYTGFANGSETKHDNGAASRVMHRLPCLSAE